MGEGSHAEGTCAVPETGRRGVQKSRSKNSGRLGINNCTQHAIPYTLYSAMNERISEMAQHQRKISVHDSHVRYRARDSRASIYFLVDLPVTSGSPL